MVQVWGCCFLYTSWELNYKIIIEFHNEEHNIPFPGLRNATQSYKHPQTTFKTHLVLVFGVFLNAYDKGSGEQFILWGLIITCEQGKLLTIKWRTFKFLIISLW